MAHIGNPQRERISPEISYARKREVREMLGFSQDTQEIESEAYWHEQAKLYWQNQAVPTVKDTWLPLETQFPSHPPTQPASRSSVGPFRENTRRLDDPSLNYFHTLINPIQPRVDPLRDSARPIEDPAVNYFQTAINSILSEERRDCICSYRRAANLPSQINTLLGR